MESIELLKMFGDIDDEFINGAGQPWKKRNSFKHNSLKIACAAAIAAVLITCIYPAQVKASIQRLTDFFNKVLGIEEDIQQYSQAVNTSVTHGDYKVTLHEAILDNDKLIVLISYERLKQSQEPGFDLGITGQVWLDNQEIVDQSSGIVNNLDSNEENTEMHVITFQDSEIHIENTANVRLNFNIVNPEGKAVTKDQFSFEFTASKEELSNRAEHFTLQERIEIKNKNAVHLTDLDINIIGSKILGEWEDVKPGAEYYLIGNDNIGNTVRYDLRSYENGKLTFIMDNNMRIAKDAASMRLRMFEKIISKEGAEMIMDGEADEDGIGWSEMKGETEPEITPISGYFKIEIR